VSCFRLSSLLLRLPSFLSGFVLVLGTVHEPLNSELQLILLRFRALRHSPSSRSKLMSALIVVDLTDPERRDVESSVLR
jgi:hypothetical protein